MYIYIMKPHQLTIQSWIAKSKLTCLHLRGHIAFRPNDTMSLSRQASYTISSNCVRSPTTSILAVVMACHISLRNSSKWTALGPSIGVCWWCRSRISIPGTAFSLTTFASQIHFDGTHSFRCVSTPHFWYLCNFCIFHDSTSGVSFAKFVKIIFKGINFASHSNCYGKVLVQWVPALLLST